MALVAALALTGRVLFDWSVPLNNTSESARQTVYQLLGAASGLAVAVFVIPLSVVLAIAPTERLADVLSHHQVEVRKALMQAASASVALLAAAIANGVADTGSEAPAPALLQLVLAVALIAVAISVVRILRILDAMLSIKADLPERSAAHDLRPLKD